MSRKVLLAGMLALLLPMHAWSAGDDDPKAVVEKAVNGVIHVLKARKDPNHITLAEREAIRRAVEGYFDFREMAKRSLGRPWKNMTPAQREEFVRTFRELLERSYGNRLSEYHNQTVRYGKVRIKGRRAFVNTEVVDAEKTTPVRYSLIHKKKGWRVYDIKVEGMSLVSTYRTDFKQSVSKNGIDGFIQALKRRVEALRKQDKGKG